MCCGELQSSMLLDSQNATILNAHFQSIKPIHAILCPILHSQFVFHHTFYFKTAMTHQHHYFCGTHTVEWLTRVHILIQWKWWKEFTFLNTKCCYTAAVIITFALANRIRLLHTQRHGKRRLKEATIQQCNNKGKSNLEFTFCGDESEYRFGLFCRCCCSILDVDKLAPFRQQFDCAA